MIGALALMALGLLVTALLARCADRPLPHRASDAELPLQSLALDVRERLVQ